MSASTPAVAPTASQPNGQTEMDALRLELAALKADLLKQAAATAAADAMKKSAVEEELRKEIALLRAASASEGPVAQHMVREALYRREPYKAVLDRHVGASWALLNPTRDIPGLLVSSSFDANQLPLSPSILVT